MTSRIIPTLVLAALTAGALCQPLAAEENPRGAATAGVLFLPPDFYPKHREELGLSEDQMHEIQRIAEGMREPGEKIQAAMREQSKALQEAISQNPVDREKATSWFQEVLKVESEMKLLQFRARIAMRGVLKPDQVAKIPELAKKDGITGNGAGTNELRAMLQQVREEIRQRVGSGEPPHEVVERLEQIEKSARDGHVQEAKEQLEAMLHHIRGEAGAASAGKGDGLEKRMRQIGEAAKNSDSPEQRERLEAAARSLREAAEAGDREAVEKIMRAIEPSLREGGKRRE